MIRDRQGLAVAVLLGIRIPDSFPTQTGCTPGGLLGCTSTGRLVLFLSRITRYRYHFIGTIVSQGSPVPCFTSRGFARDSAGPRRAPMHGPCLDQESPGLDRLPCAAEITSILLDNACESFHHGSMVGHWWRNKMPHTFEATSSLAFGQVGRLSHSPVAMPVSVSLERLQSCCSRRPLQPAPVGRQRSHRILGPQGRGREQCYGPPPSRPALARRALPGDGKSARGSTYPWGEP